MAKIDHSVFTPRESKGHYIMDMYVYTVTVSFSILLIGALAKNPSLKTGGAFLVTTSFLHTEQSVPTNYRL